MRRLLLISSSKTHGTGFLDHCGEAIVRRLEGIDRILFVPYALADRDGYAELVAERFLQWGLATDSIHRSDDPVRSVLDAAAVFVGGGNTFRLLKTLYEHNLLDPIRRRVGEGMPYLGSSAGTNIAGPTIRTTNDMPIVEPPSFDALGLVSFQINPHYVDADPDRTHQGETREMRLAEYLEENNRPVYGLREGGWLWIDGERVELQGSRSMRCFRRGQAATEIAPGLVTLVASS